jgi:hypothetical protein
MLGRYERSRTARVMTTLMRNGQDRRSENPLWVTRRKSARKCLGPISGSHQGRRPKRPHSQAGYMTAPERFAESQIPLALRAPSIHDPQLTFDRVVGCNRHSYNCPFCVEQPLRLLTTRSASPTASGRVRSSTTRSKRLVGLRLQLIAKQYNLPVPPVLISACLLQPWLMCAAFHDVFSPPFRFECPSIARARSAGTFGSCGG